MRTNVRNAWSSSIALALAACGGGDAQRSIPQSTGTAGASAAAGAGSAGLAAASNGGQPGSASPDRSAPAGSGAIAGREASSSGSRASMRGRAGNSANASDSSTAGAAGSSTAGAASATISSGCGKDPGAAGEHDLEVGGKARLYIVDLPDNYDKTKPYPLITAFHGAGLAAASFKSFFKLTPAVGGEAIVAYLEALGDPTGWEYQRDLPYFDAVLTELESQFCIDESRVFATGHSSGGYFTNALGCQRGDVLRGIAPISGGAAFSSNCKDKVAAWIAHGAMDNIVPTDEGRDARDLWIKQSDCDADMPMPVEPESCVTYAGCDANNPVHYCEYEGDHNLPKFGTRALWTFFRAL